MRSTRARPRPTARRNCPSDMPCRPGMTMRRRPCNRGAPCLHPQPTLCYNRGMAPLPASLPETHSPIPARADGAPRLAWHAAPPEEAAAYWEAGIDGLTDDEARVRLARVGPNRLTEA